MQNTEDSPIVNVPATIVRRGKVVWDKAMTKAEALIWLAGLEKGGVPVLPDLREPCRYNRRHEPGPYYPELSLSCPNCQGRNWRPKQGRDVLYTAMEKDGWGYDIHQTRGGYRQVNFYKDGPLDRYQHSHILNGKAADDHMAAVNALQAAGY